ncbi:MAG: hypothetical protein E7218_05805 [Anaerofustis stercorihominis]|nr:hypothetical protein [Anaerofustis stercorihominis]
MKATIKQWLTYGFAALCLMSSSFIFGQTYADVNIKEPTYENDKYIKADTNTDSFKLGPEAQIIYMKYFTMSESYSISYADIKAQHIGMDISEAKDFFSGWDVVYLDEEKIILQKTIDSYGPQTYTISTIKQDDTEYVCVYEYDDNGYKTIHSIFDTPVDLFDEETVNKLKNGVIVTGKDELMTALEAFGE